MRNKKGQDIANILVPILYGLLAIIIGLLVCASGQYPYGSETMTHVYRADAAYNAILNGNIVPLYDYMWYNGVEVLTYTAPAPMYIMAVCQAVVGGDPIDGYLFFTGVVFFLSAMAWYFIGKRKNRLYLGAFMGVLWFFMPNNLFVMFFEGNLPRAFAMIILPVFISYVYDYLHDGDRHHLIKIIVTYAIMALCDLEYVQMIFVAVILLAVVYGIINHQWRKSLYCIVSLVIGFLVGGIWTVPATLAATDINNAEIMYRYFQSIFKSLNPIERYVTSNEYYYFGLASFAIAIFGLVAGKRKTETGFVTALLILICTTSSMYAVMSIMPGKDALLMCQYISLALCLILYGVLNWNSLRPVLQIVLCVLLVIDVIPSLNLVYGRLSGVSVTERMDEQDETTLIRQAKEVSQQRIALLDESVLESMGAYLVSDYGDGRAASFGGDWYSAVSRPNLMQLNRALTSGFYPYLFDRAKELGNDTVLVKLSQMDIAEAPVELLDDAAVKAGYELVGQNEFYRLYDMDIDGNWGTVAKYPAIGIGSQASVISLCYPAVKEVTSTNLNDFTFEELSQYELIYLAGFTYDNRESAEKLIRDLSNSGVRIIILADGIPEDDETHTQSFLNIVCNDISFSNGYPLLDTKVGVLDCDFFPQGYDLWTTVYVNGLDETWGTVREENLDLDFYGTVENENIIVLGLNLTYFYSLTMDEGVAELLHDITKFAAGRMPEREIVPLEVVYGEDSIAITSDRDEVNTSLAYHNMFESNEQIGKENNLLYVNSGTTMIYMKYENLFWGIAATVAGGVMTFFLCRYSKKKEENE